MADSDAPPPSRPGQGSGLALASDTDASGRASRQLQWRDRTGFTPDFLFSPLAAAHPQQPASHRRALLNHSAVNRPQTSTLRQTRQTPATPGQRFFLGRMVTFTVIPGSPTVIPGSPTVIPGSPAVIPGSPNRHSGLPQPAFRAPPAGIPAPPAVVPAPPAVVPAPPAVVPAPPAVIPAKAGIYACRIHYRSRGLRRWIPAQAGMTVIGAS